MGPEESLAFAKAHHCIIYWANWIHPKISHSVCPRSILILGLSSFIRLGLSCSLFIASFLAKILYLFLSSLWILLVPTNSSLLPYVDFKIILPFTLRSPNLFLSMTFYNQMLYLSLLPPFTPRLMTGGEYKLLSFTLCKIHRT